MKPVDAGKALAIDRVNYVNIGLMLLSGGLALVVPFYLFLFSYAVLGPLHYLTEISWLHDRNYFLQRKRHVVPLILATAAITFFVFALPTPFFGRLGYLILALALVFAGLAVGRKSVDNRVILFGVLICAAAIFWTQPKMLLLIGVFVPTLVHVFVFTGAFIFAGNLKSRRLSGFASLAVFLGMGALLILWHPAMLDPGTVSDYEQRTYGRIGDSSSFGFAPLNYFILQLFGVGVPPASARMSVMSSDINDILYHHPAARALMAFIAYAYTYHYLNWFSKTSVIGWHKTPPKRLYAMLAIWFASLGIYACDYRMGLKWLFFLSLLHVVMELPLNYVTFFAIGKSVRGLPRVLARQAS